MDEELQKQYSPSVWNKRLPADQVVDAHKEFMLKHTDLARQNLSVYVHKFSHEDDEESLEIFYKKDSLEVNDSTFPKLTDKKIFLYIHGGYWQWGSVSMSSFMAENLTNKNVIVIALGHSLAPKVRVTNIVEQVERGVAKILENSDKSEIYICGHSAGGHLAAMILYTDFKMKYQVDATQIKGLIPVSGVYDLLPLLKTDVNDNLKMDFEEAIRLSPLLKRDCLISDEGRKNLKILLAYGEHESDAFKKQSNDYKQCLINMKFSNINCMEISDTDHFDVIEKLVDENFILTKEIFNLMEIN